MQLAGKETRQIVKPHLERCRQQMGFYFGRSKRRRRCVEFQLDVFIKGEIVVFHTTYKRLYSFNKPCLPNLLMPAYPYPGDGSCEGYPAGSD